MAARSSLVALNTSHGAGFVFRADAHPNRSMLTLSTTSTLGMETVLVVIPWTRNGLLSDHLTSIFTSIPVHPATNSCLL